MKISILWRIYQRKFITSFWYTLQLGHRLTVVVLYLKRVDDAIRDGNPIRAIIRSTVSNSDGKTPGLAHPSAESHEALILACYKHAGIDDFSRTGFVECHGTGTQTGDPIEAAAVANVFGDKGMWIGSVKVS